MAVEHYNNVLAGLILSICTKYPTVDYNCLSGVYPTMYLQLHASFSITELYKFKLNDYYNKGGHEHIINKL